MPSKPCNHAVTIPLVLYLEHHAFVRFVDSAGGFRDYAVEACSLEAPEPIFCNVPVTCSRSEVNGSRNIFEERFQFVPAHFERLTGQVTIATAQQIEEHN